MSNVQPKLKMLIVDDEPDNLDLLYRTFRLSFQVLRAESAPEALAILDQQGEVAIIISDQRMPEMLGTEFLSKTVDRYPDTIRIVLTAYTDVKDLVDAINSGKVFKYITKPWNQQQLQSLVQQAAETYQLVKQRTYDLQRALRRESIFNEVTTAIRGSLDCRSILKTIVATLGKTFEAHSGLLYPVEDDQLEKPLQYVISNPEAWLQNGDSITPLIQQVLLDRTTQTLDCAAVTGDTPRPATHHLVIPLSDQTNLLAILSLCRVEASGSWSQEDIALIEGVAEQAALAISQARLYQRTQLQAEKMSAELAVARQIQNNLLRQTLPELKDLRVQACCHPAREVGGDFFEVYQHPGGDLWLAVGDVSGKGVPAALFMASSISVLRRELAQEVSPEPAEVMRNLNTTLLEDLMSTNCFITMVLARYNPTTQKLDYANAGHIYPLIWSRQDKLAEPDYLKTRGIPLGILPHWKGMAGTCSLTPGQMFLLTSDGVTEASLVDQLTSTRLPTPQNKPQSQPAMTGAMLQQSGLWELLLQELDDFDLKHLLARIREQTAAQEDDQTMLSLEVL
jgi:serine phosphatase RsbU (regulator of sigma subunit)/CheY-like chemotaxis protein